MTSFLLKIIAAVSMLIDHTGLILFPGVTILRIIGRMAFPLYAFCIAEGFRHTRSRLKYFLRVFLLGAVCQIVYTIVDHKLYFGILITFSLSIVLMVLTECVRSTLHGEHSTLAKLWQKLTASELSLDADRTISTAICCAAFILVFILTMYVKVDYGFFGVMLPVFANLFREPGQRLVLFTACLLALCIDMTDTFAVQYWSLLTVPLLALYNGKPGKYRMKWFFYIFYPVHLVVLYGISMIL